MSKKPGFALAAAAVGFAAVFSALLVVDRADTASAVASVTVGLEQGMVLKDAEAILAERNFSRSSGREDDGDEFDFSVPASNAEAAYFIGGVGPDDTSFMVRIEHRNGSVVAVTAEKLRFRTAG